MTNNQDKIEEIKTFDLVRTEDESGISGIGKIAWGCVFPDGTTILRWRTMNGSTAVYDSPEHCESIHGHNGKTKIVYRQSPDIYEQGKREEREEIRNKLEGMIDEAITEDGDEGWGNFAGHWDEFIEAIGRNKVLKEILQSLTHPKD